MYNNQREHGALIRSVLQSATRLTNVLTKMLMRYLTVYFFFIILICIKEFGSVFSDLNTARYDNYRVYHVELATEQHVAIFQELEEKSDSCTFMGHARHPKQKLTIMVAAHKIADFADLLRTYNIKHDVLSYNFQEVIDQNNGAVLPKDTNPKNMDWQHYFHLETIYGWMDLLAQDYGNDVNVINIGESTQGIPIKGLSIKKNQNKNVTTIFIESGIHAREWIAPATATFIINELLFSNDTVIQRFARNFNWIIFPVINPDGYKYTTFDGDRMWRKNRENFGLCRGVDLNRNYPFHWNTTGTSGDPCCYDYSGPIGASEIETKNVIKFLEENSVSKNVKTFISLHSYSQMIMFPYGHTAERVYNYEDLTRIGKSASEKIKQISGRTYISGSIYETIYPSSGGSKDWAHGILKVPITFSFELRGPPDSKDLFILPAVEIEPTAEEAFAAIITIVEESEKLGYYS